MIHMRRLEIIDSKKKGELTMKVAFASTDKVHVDEHFGRAQAFYLWDIGPETAEFTGVIQVNAQGSDEAGRIEARCSGLEDCAIVYVAQIGGPAAARLVQKKIHPVKSKDCEPIAQVVEKLQQVLKGNPPPWLRKAMLKSERPGFVER